LGWGVWGGWGGGVVAWAVGWGCQKMNKRGDSEDVLARKVSRTSKLEP